MRGLPCPWGAALALALSGLLGRSGHAMDRQQGDSGHRHGAYHPLNQVVGIEEHIVLPLIVIVMMERR